MTYLQTLDYLYTHLPLFSRSGAAAYKKDITNTVLLCEAAGHPEKKVKTIHVAGTNGKGSVCHMLAAIFQQHGYRTGLYTSPHLKDFRERIKIDGQFIAEEFVVSFVEKMKDVSESIQPSFFELTVVMALEYFATQEVDIAIIETGLGGRLDSTNVIIPCLSIITNIGYDHMNLLGNTLEEIAFEKAGIIKQGVPVVLGEINSTRKIFEEKAGSMNAPILFAEEERKIIDIKSRDLMDVIIEGRTGRKEYRLDLPGLYQKHNLLTVLAALDVLNTSGYSFENPKVSEALQQVKSLTGLHGRWEIIGHNPMVVLDVAHNADGIRQLVLQLSVTPYRKLHIVFGLVKDKAVDDILALLPRNASYYFTRAHIPRALPVEELEEKAATFHLHGEKSGDVNEALSRALAQAGEEDLVIICGSVFVVGEVNHP